MDNRKRKTYMRYLLLAYEIAKLDGTDMDSDAFVLRQLWDDAAMKMAQDGSVQDYEWIKANAGLIGSTQWA